MTPSRRINCRCTWCFLLLTILSHLAIVLGVAELVDGEGGMDAAFMADLRPKLDAIDLVRSLLDTSELSFGVELPSIVVVGDQNSGKSSVLEGLSGVALPRSDGLVTRCPLLLKLRRAERTSVVLSYEGKYISLTVPDIPEAITQATRVLAGSRSNIVTKLITLEVRRPDAPDLTMVDLPGIIHTPSPGQHKDIEQHITDLIKEHIKGDSKIILCILPVTSDMATQAAIKLARQADPYGQRTLGVVTKGDMHPSKLRGLLQATAGNEWHMRLGYVAVRCRNQEELIKKISIEEMYRLEAQFFANSEELSQLPTDIKGMPALVDKLVKLQAQRIKSHLPSMKKQVDSQIQSTTQELQKLQGVILTAVDAENTLSGLLDRLQRRFEGLVNADYDVAAGDHTNNRLHVAPRVDEMLKEYGSEAWDEIGGRDFFYTSKCHQLLKSHSKEVSGTGLPNMLGERVFKVVYTQVVYVNMRAAPAHLVNNIYTYLLDILSKLIADVFSGFARLGQEVQTHVESEMWERRVKSEASVETIIDSEQHIFTTNKGYPQGLLDLNMRFTKAGGQEQSSQDSTKPSRLLGTLSSWQSRASEDSVDVIKKFKAKNLDGEQILLEVLENNQALIDLQLSLIAYTEVVMKSLSDSVPKVVYNQLVTKLAVSLQTIIRQRMQRDEALDIKALMHDPQRAAEHMRLADRLAALKKARLALINV